MEMIWLVFDHLIKHIISLTQFCLGLLSGASVDFEVFNSSLKTCRIDGLNGVGGEFQQGATDTFKVNKLFTTLLCQIFVCNISLQFF